MDVKYDDKGYRAKDNPGLVLKCHKCGCDLPLLHPHIMVERTDEDGDLICEQCYEEHYASGRPGSKGPP